MSPSNARRGIAFCLSAMLTLAMLGSIDQLSQRDNGASGWAQQSLQSTPRG